MAATRADISRWFDDGLRQGATHMIVVCDDYDYEDYPVYVYEHGEDARTKADRYGKKPMQRVMECYAMHCDKARQLDAHRVMIFEEPPRHARPNLVRPGLLIQEEPD